MFICTDCKSFKQFIEPFCRRIRFEEYTEIYKSNWREGINEMKSITPNLKYAIIPSDQVLETDLLMKSFKKFALIEI